MPGLSVLVVDDDPTLRLVAFQILEPLGYAVSQAEDGAVGLTLLHQSRPDVVILDMLMPNKEGMETLLEIRQLWPDQKVLAISGGGRIGAEDLLHWAHMAGADATMTKPLDPERLVRTLEDLAAQPERHSA